MLLFLKNIFKSSPDKNIQTKKNPSSFLFLFGLTVLEDVLFWKKWWLSLLFYVCFSIIFMVCVYRQLNLLQIFVSLTMITLGIDAFEVWLKYKHRTTCLKRLTAQDIDKLPSIAKSINNLIEKKFFDFLYLRDRNHTKAFLLLQIIFSVTLFVGKYINGYILTYCFCTFIIFFAKIVPQFMKIVRKIQLNAESDLELEGLLPDDSDANLDLLTIEPERKTIVDDRQSLEAWSDYILSIFDSSCKLLFIPGFSDINPNIIFNSLIEYYHKGTSKMLPFWDFVNGKRRDRIMLALDDYWKPDDIPLEEVSDSSDSSSSLVTNLSIAKMQTLTKDVEVTDSSEDEYMPQEQPPQELRTSLEVQPAGTWSNTAYNMFSNIGGAMVNMVYSSKEDKRRKRVSSADSSDGFEIINENDVI